MEADKHWRIVKGVAFFILLALFLHLMVVVVAPDLSNPMRKAAIPAILLGSEHLYRESGQRGTEGIDVLDETPLLDIKPYMPEFDVRTEVRAGWYENRSIK